VSEMTSCDALGGPAIDWDDLLVGLGSDDWQERRQATAMIASLSDARIDSELFAMVGHDDAGTRNAALKALIKRSGTALPFLVEGLVSSEERVRILCAVAIGQTGADSAVPLLRDLFERDTDPNVRYMIIEALGRIGGSQVVPFLIGMLAQDPWLAAPAAEALGRQGARGAVDPLIRIASDDVAGGVAIDALGRLGDLRALPFLLRHLNTVSPETAQVLVMSAGRLLAESHDDTSKGIGVLVEGAGELGADAVEVVHQMLRHGGECSTLALELVRHLRDERFVDVIFDLADEPALCACAAEALAATPIASGDVLDRASRSTIESRRLLAAQAAGRHSFGTGVLVRLIDDPHDEVRAVALAGLLERGADESGVIGALADPSELVRAVALGWLLEHGIRDCTKLESLIGHGTPPSRTAAALALAACEPSAAARRLAETAARDSDPRVRVAVAHALKLSPGLADSVLASALLKDSDPGARAGAAEAILSSQDVTPAEIALLAEDDSPLVRIAVARHATGQSEGGPAMVAALLADSDPRVVVSALDSLSAISDDTLGPHLERLAHSDSADIREACVRACARTACQGLPEYLRSALSDTAWNVRAAAVELICSLDSDDVGAAVVEALTDADTMVRRTAVAAIGPEWPQVTVGLLEAMLHDHGLTDEVRAALSRLGAEGVAVLAADTKSGRAAEAFVSALMLADSELPEAAAAADNLARDEDCSVRFAIALACVAHGKMSSRARATWALGCEDDPLVRLVLRAACDEPIGDSPSDQAPIDVREGRPTARRSCMRPRRAVV